MVLAFSGVVFAQQSTKAPDRQQKESTTPENGGEQQATTSEDEQQPSQGGRIPGRYIVVLKDDAPGAEQVASEHARRDGSEVSHIYRGRALKGYAARIPDNKVQEVRNDERVLFVDEDREVRAFAPKNRQGDVQAASETPPTGVQRIGADQNITTNGSVGVAVLDTGIDVDHPDLNVAGGKNTISRNGNTDCTTRNKTSFDDDNGHGTHVAGTVGAIDNESDVIGVAPGTPLYAVKVLDRNGSGYRSDVICGIEWVTTYANALNIKVANMSLGGSGSDDGEGENGKDCTTTTDAYRKAICNSINNSKVTYVVAAGNGSADFKGSVPAAYNEVLTVTNLADFDGSPGGTYTGTTCVTDEDDTARSTSNYTTVGTSIGDSDQTHTIAAPGTCIESTRRGGGTTVMTGTSMASPHMAGTVARCIASGACSGLSSPSQIISKLHDDAANESGTDNTVSNYYGFQDDPNSPTTKRIGNKRTGYSYVTLYYGHLGYAGAY